MTDAVLFMDQFEPVEMEGMLRQAVEVVVGPLNKSGRADYYWLDVVGNARQWERKQVGEALSDLGAVEEQLNEELRSCDELTWVVEGIARPHPQGAQTYRMSRDARFFHPYVLIPPEGARPQPGLWSRYEALKCGLRAAGVEVVETWSLEGTAQALVAAFRHSMRKEHTTLRRYLRPHIPPFSPNPYVDNLARLRGTGVGPTLAEKLIERFGTFWDVFDAGMDEIAEVIGPQRAKRLLDTVGRVE